MKVGLTEAVGSLQWINFWSCQQLRFILQCEGTCGSPPVEADRGAFWGPGIPWRRV